MTPEASEGMRARSRQYMEDTQDVHPAILEIPYHSFVESEFPEGRGRCDTCGGGEGAEIHQKPVDQMARIADALERIADSLERVEGGGPSMSYDEVQALLEQSRTRTKADGE